MSHSYIQFDLLAGRYLEGKLSVSEYDEFLRLMQQEEYAIRFREIKNNWVPVDNSHTATNWQRLNRRIFTRSASANSKIRILKDFWFHGVAAVLILGLIMSTVFFYFKSDNYIHGLTVVETPRGEKSKVTLPDGSVVWLNASSRLEYDSFTGEARNVKLVGEAYFKIKRNEQAPFTVQTSKCDVKVLGTEFNVMAYDQLQRNEVTLFKGSVEVQADHKQTILEVGEKLTVARNSQTRQLADLEQTYGWVENKLNFSEIPFVELIMRLENWYDVDIIYNRNEFSNVKFTGSFKNEETIWQIIDAIGVYMPITYKEIDNRKIELVIK